MKTSHAKTRTAVFALCGLGCMHAPHTITRVTFDPSSGHEMVVQTRFVPAAQYAAVLRAEVARAQGHSEEALQAYREAYANGEPDAWLEQRLASCRAGCAPDPVSSLTAASRAAPSSAAPLHAATNTAARPTPSAPLCLDEQMLFGVTSEGCER